MGDKKITASRLRELVFYDESSGDIRWIVKKGPKNPGDLAGYLRSDGYIYIRLDGVLYSAHRIAWLYMNGSFPDSCVDHKNGIKNDNRKENLRSASMQENMRNRGTQKNNTSGFKGVGFHKVSGRWKSSIKVNGKSIQLGFFKTPEEAHLAYCIACKKYHGEFSNTGS